MDRIGLGSCPVRCRLNLRYLMLVRQASKLQHHVGAVSICSAAFIAEMVSQAVVSGLVLVSILYLVP